MKSALALGFIVITFLPALLFVSVPLSALAAEPLVPEACRGAGASASCNACELVGLIENLVELFIEIMLIVGTIIVVVAGFKLVTSGGDVAAKEGAKKMLVNAILGLLIVLAAWLIVETIIVAIFGGEVVTRMPWNNLEDVCHGAFSGGGAGLPPGGGNGGTL